MVLVVLALVWAVVLGPSLLRRALDRQSKDSIGSFHRQLHVLGRTGPSLVPPAHRLGIATAQRQDTLQGDWLPTTRSIDESGGQPDRGRGAFASPSRRSDPYFRPEACKRRRDVFMVLVCLLFMSGLLGVIPALHVLLAVTAFAATLLVVYVGLLIRLRTHAIEREVKLRYLPSAADHEPVMVRMVASR